MITEDGEDHCKLHRFGSTEAVADVAEHELAEDGTDENRGGGCIHLVQRARNWTKIMHDLRWKRSQQPGG